MQTIPWRVKSVTLIEATYWFEEEEGGENLIWGL